MVWEIRSGIQTSLVGTPLSLNQGLSKFSGPVVHSAEWDPAKFSASGRRLSVIGTGASAVQIVPNVADEAKELNVFQRTPTWSPPRSGKVKIFPTVFITFVLKRGQIFCKVGQFLEFTSTYLILLRY